MDILILAILVTGAYYLIHAKCSPSALVLKSAPQQATGSLAAEPNAGMSNVVSRLRAPASKLTSGLIVNPAVFNAPFTSGAPAVQPASGEILPTPNGQVFVTNESREPLNDSFIPGVPVKRSGPQSTRSV